MPTNPVFTLVDASGNVLGGATALLSVSSAAQTAANTGTSFSTPGASGLGVDINVTAFTGGTSPAVTFFVDRLGSDGVWYRTWTSSAITTVSAVSQIIGPYPAATGVTTAILTGTARLGWSFTGTPTSVTFSVSVSGR
jgi:hypothetical protein